MAGWQFDILSIDIGMPQVNGRHLLIHARRHAIGCSATPPPQSSHPPQLAAPQSRNNPTRGKSGGEFLPQFLSGFGREAVLAGHHHERSEGTERPDGLAGEKMLDDLGCCAGTRFKAARWHGMSGLTHLGTLIP